MKGRDSVLAFTVLVSMLVSADGAAQSSQESDLAAYGRALQRAIVSRWDWPVHAPQGSACKVRISQRAGGEVTNSIPTPECSFDESGKASIQDAIAKASPLPYEGFESVFQSELILNFRVPDRPPRREPLDEAAAAAYARKSAETSRYKVLSPQNQSRFGTYVEQCVRQIELQLQASDELPRRPLTRTMTVSVRSDGSLGNVVPQGTVPYEPVSANLIRVTRSVRPCSPFPPEMQTDTASLQFSHDFRIRR